MDLGGLAVVAAPKPERGIDDQAADDDQHRHRDQEDAGVNRDDVAGVGAGAVQRTDVDGADVDRDQCSSHAHTRKQPKQQSTLHAHDSVITAGAPIDERATSVLQVGVAR